MREASVFLKNSELDVFFRQGIIKRTDFSTLIVIPVFQIKRCQSIALNSDLTVNVVPEMGNKAGTIIIIVFILGISGSSKLIMDILAVK